MANFPLVSSITPTVLGVAAASIDVAMPASVSAGDLLIMMVVRDGLTTGTNLGTPAGWASIWNNSGGGTHRFAGYAKDAVGTEGGTTVNVTITASDNDACAQVYQITNWHGDLTGVEDAQASGANNPNPPTLTPSWGNTDTLWIAAYARDGAGAPDAYPTNYSTGQTYTESGATASFVAIASARRELTAATEDPGVFTQGSVNWIASTIAVRGIGPILVGGGSTGGKGKGGGKGGGTGSPPPPPGKLKTFGVGHWNMGSRRWF